VVPLRDGRQRVEPEERPVLGQRDALTAGLDPQPLGEQFGEPGRVDGGEFLAAGQRAALAQPLDGVHQEVVHRHHQRLRLRAGVPVEAGLRQHVEEAAVQRPGLDRDAGLPVLHHEAGVAEDRRPHRHLLRRKRHDARREHAGHDPHNGRPRLVDGGGHRHVPGHRRVDDRAQHQVDDREHEQQRDRLGDVRDPARHQRRHLLVVGNRKDRGDHADHHGDGGAEEPLRVVEERHGADDRDDED
jgi:hypothetical protein